MTDTTDVPVTTSRVEEGFSEIYAGALARNALYEKLIAGLVLVCIIGAMGLYRSGEREAQAKVVFIRTDDLGRHEMVHYDTATANRPREHEIRTDLKDFAVKHLSRLRSVVARDFWDSLFYLSPVLQDEAMRVTKVNEIDPFLLNSGQDEVEISIRDVKITSLDATPFRAEVAFDKVFYMSGTRQIRQAAESWTMHLLFEIIPAPYEALRVNPRGVRILNKRLERAYTAPQQQAARK